MVIVIQMGRLKPMDLLTHLAKGMGFLKPKEKPMDLLTHLAKVRQMEI